MRRGHFESLRPVCPVCGEGRQEGSALRLARVEREESGHIIEGVLHCENPVCLREYPILDGIPILVAGIRQYISDNILSIYGRGDLSAFTESILGDCCGANSAFDLTRQHQSSYTWDHYADLDPRESRDSPRPGAMRANLEAGLRLAAPLAGGSAVDVGCSVGRSTFALAEAGSAPVVGIDLNFSMLRLASSVLREGRVVYPRRRTGVVYERREFAVEFKSAEQVDFWACDVSALPFRAGTFSAASALNVLDCVPDPRGLLASLARVLKPGGKAIISCPYDWSASATPIEAWLGGHSQRSALEGTCEAVLRDLLTPGAHPASINELRLTAELANVPWQVRLHDRSLMSYAAHLVVAQRTG